MSEKKKQVVAPRGTNDFYGNYMVALQELEGKMRTLCDDYGYGEIRTPIFEHTELFLRGVGDTTDIVQKEMYTFEDKKGRSITLKPEGTAGVVRSFIERKMFAETIPAKFYYITPAFRYEKPQAGRFRQFHQFGVELFGSEKPSADAEIISLGAQMLERLGIKNIKVHVNSLGNVESRKRYNDTLLSFLHEKEEELCDQCKERMEKNPLRVLDCKNESCKNVLKSAPLILEHLDKEDKEHFDTVIGYLEAMGIEYVIDPWIVRGLDYYTRTVFEFISYDIGAQGTVCGGGRYDNLIEQMGGKPLPSVGFGAGIERLLMVVENTVATFDKGLEVDIYLGAIGEDAKKKVMQIAGDLRRAHIKTTTDLMDKSVKAQMKYANKIGAKYAAIIGDSEIESKKVRLKHMETGEETETSFEEMITIVENGGN